MRYAIHLYPYSAFATIETLIHTVTRAEELGFDTVCLPEHIAFPTSYNSTMGGVWWDPIVLATHLAASTQRVKLLTSVIVLAQRHPAILAKELATLDVLSGGRISLGVGIGWIPEELAVFGVDLRTRAARTDESIAALRELWMHEPASFDGKYVSFREVSSLPKPVQRPHPPIVVGGGVASSARRAARIGDGWMPMAASTEEFESGIEILHAEAARAGRSLDGFEICGRLPMWEPSDEAVEHTEQAGAHTRQMTYLHDDFQAARALVDHLATRGVTLLRVDLPSEGTQMIERMEQFASAMITASDRTGDVAAAVAAEGS